METEEPQGDGVAVYRPPGRPGVGFFKVQMAADALLRDGTRPTVEKIRARVGGSPNTIIVHLDKWWALLAKRIEIGSEVFERLPRPYAQLAESFFHQSMEEFRRLARAETDPQRDDAAAKAEQTRQRTLLLDEREKELAEVIADRDNRIAALESALAERRGQITTLLASQEASLRRLSRMSTEIRRMHERLLMSPVAMRPAVSRTSKSRKRRQLSTLGSRKRLLFAQKRKPGKSSGTKRAE